MNAFWRKRAGERTVRVQSLKRLKLYKGSPLSFNVYLENKKSSHIIGLTMKEAIRLHRELGKRL